MDSNERTYVVTGKVLTILFGVWMLSVASLYWAPPGITESDWYGERASPSEQSFA